jgi:hypothetical protein
MSTFWMTPDGGMITSIEAACADGLIVITDQGNIYVLAAELLDTEMRHHGSAISGTV